MVFLTPGCPANRWEWNSLTVSGISEDGIYNPEHSLTERAILHKIPLINSQSGLEIRLFDKLWIIATYSHPFPVLSLPFPNPSSQPGRKNKMTVW